jgi:signal transduction histidine kinase
MTAEISEIHRIDPATTERSEPNEHWLAAWVVLGGALAALVALNIFTWWVEFGGSVDPEAVIAAEPTFQSMFRYFGLEFTGDSLGFGALLVFSALALSRDHTNRFAWILGGSVLSWMTGTALSGLAAVSVAGLIPAALTPGLTWSSETAYAVFSLGLMVMIAVFPSGRLPTGWWRHLLLFAVALAALSEAARLLAPGPIVSSINPIPTTFDNPLGVGFLTGVDPEIARLGVIVLPIVAVASLIRTYMRSGPEVRHQVKWIVAVIPVMVATSGLMTFIETPWEGLPVMVALWLFAAALGVAITKYRLYDIDLIINRAVVYGSLALFIGVVYVSIVVGVGTLLGFRDESNPALAIAATALVAIGFQPARRRLERFANRLVFGRKATPYEVLSEFSRRVAATDDSLLGAVSRSLVEGTSATRAAVSVWVDDELVESAVWPESGDDPGGEKLAVPIEHEGVELGVLTLVASSGQTLSEEDAGLAGQVASGMGLALKNRLLTERLQSRVEDLRESRRRLVAVQDETRRKLERDLHDGAQQQLVALKVKLGLSRMIAEKEGASEMVDLLSEIGADADDAVESLRRFARGVYPPLLEAEGLVAAVTAHARNSEFPVVVETDGIGRYPKEIESTVYFCVLEALRGSTGPGEPVDATVRLAQLNGSVTFEIRRDGHGFDPAPDSVDTRLVNMRDRMDAIAGTLTAVSRPDEGTVISGSIPVSPEVMA